MKTVRRNAGFVDLNEQEMCLLHVAEQLERPLSIPTILAALTGPSETLSIPGLIEVAEKAGLQAAYGARKLRNFDKALSPAILLLKNGQAVVFHGYSADNRPLIYDPAQGGSIGEVEKADLEAKYTGYAILFRRSSTTDSMAHHTPKAEHWFWAAMASNRWSYMQVALAATMTNLLGLSTSVFIMVVYDRILPNEATESLIALTIGVGLALTFDFILKLLRAGFIDRAGQKADKIIGRKVFDQIINIRMAARTGSTGAMASTVREFETLREFFTSATLVAVVDLPFIAIFIFAIHLVGGPLAIIPALAVPVVLLTGIAVQPVLSRMAENSFADGQSKQSVLIETVSGLETIKTTASATRMRTRWDDAIERQSTHTARSRAVTQFALNITGFTQQAAQVMIVFYGVFLVTAGQATMGALIASVMLTGRALAPLGQLAQTLTRVNQARSAYRNLNALMCAGSERPEGRNWIERPKTTGHITFKNVGFSYPDDDQETLSNVSFEIRPGEKVAILGPIGSGKSTIARLLLGLYEPSAGSILLDGVDIRQIDPGNLRRNIGSVLQDVWLFSGTLRDNIASGTLRARDQDVIEASKIAGVEDFINQSANGYDMEIAERGEGLSGGQKQAIALARALIGRPPILLMDEPTSAMDIKTEAKVIQQLKAATGDATMVVVTHRTSLLSLVDRVIIIENGNVSADGPKSLLNQHAQKSRRHLNVAAS